MSGLWIKVCGLTTPEAVRAAAESGVDAIGFVFAPSKRQVTPSQAKQLSTLAPPQVLKVAVMLHPSQAQLDEVLAQFLPDVLQTDAQDFADLRLPRSVRRLPVYRNLAASAGTPPNRMLYEGAVSGAGTKADWTAAASVARQVELVLAGGLTPNNVADAVRTVRPFGVDVSSGVEATPGIKDPDKIHAFVSAARAAARSEGR